ncbi:MAG TPA: tetratricopeptide repeat protein [Gemmataceae bacterium]|nr:tetratricopeptide repeat protein [Gemmataceae bacterium]
MAYWRVERRDSTSERSGAPDRALDSGERSGLAEGDTELEAAFHNPGYVGPRACAPCHAKRVAEFQTTRHFLACRLAHADSMPPGFAPGQGRYTTRNPALRFDMAQADGNFTVTAVRSTAQGDQRTTAPIGLIYGSAGAADEIYFTWHGNGLYELPIAWLHPQRRWAEQPLDPQGAGDFTRTTTPRCLECHNTWFEHVPGTENQYQANDAILGVTCEKCHGPGRDHVAYHQAHPTAESGHAIVHPGHLARARQMDVCAQCHSNAPKLRGPAFSYRPGERLEQYFRTNVNTRREEDHVANQVSYLRQSKCFQKHDGLTCTTCHNPHRSSVPGNASAVQRACLKCHKPADCAEQERVPAAVRSNCVGCHMPRFTRIQVFFHTEDEQYLPPIRPHEHRIAVYPMARQEVLRDWYGTQADDKSRREAARLSRELVEFWWVEAERYVREYRFMAALGALREALRLDPTPASRAKFQQVAAIQARLDGDWYTALHQVDEHRYPEAIQTLEAILTVKPDSAGTHAKLGAVYAAVRRNDLALQHLQAVAHDDPDDDRGYAMLGWLAYLQGKAEEALGNYRRADEIEPFSAKTNYLVGLALLRLDKLSEASKSFRRVLSIDPNHAEAHHGLSLIEHRQGQAAEALRLARRAARLSRFQNADILLNLADISADAGRFAEAEDAASRALAALETTHSERAPQARERLEDIRSRRLIHGFKK